MIAHQFHGVRNVEVQRARLERIKAAYTQAGWTDIFCSMDYMDVIRATERTCGCAYVQRWCHTQQLRCSHMCFLLTETVPSRGMKRELDTALQRRQSIVIVAHQTVLSESWAVPFRIAGMTPGAEFYTYTKDTELGSVVPY